jgi:type IV secretory pathway TrbF-like protein
MGPLEVDYTVSWPSDSYSSHATFSKAGNHHIDLDVPSAVAATGGSFTVTFTNIKDVNGCSARASDQSVSFDVKTTRASPHVPRVIAKLSLSIHSLPQSSEN